MTHSEDVTRTRATQETQEFLLQRIEALEKHVEFLSAQLEVAKQITFNN